MSDFVKDANVSTNDLISRQAAIDELNDEAELLRRALDYADLVGAEREKFGWGLGLIEACISDMKDLPSAQPEVVRCKDCKHYKRSKIDKNRKMCFRKDVDGWPVCYDFYPTDFCSYGERKTKGD